MSTLGERERAAYADGNTDTRDALAAVVLAVLAVLS